MCKVEYKGEKFNIRFHYSFVEKKLPYKLIFRRQLINGTKSEKNCVYKTLPQISGGTTKLLKTVCEIVKEIKNDNEFIKNATETVSIGETIQGTYRDKDTKELKTDNLNYGVARIQSFWYALTDIKDLHLALKLLYSYFHDFNRTKAAQKNLEAMILMGMLLDEFNDIKRLDDNKFEEAVV
jgi:hypothetical protein